jgi:hypothetical protein
MEKSQESNYENILKSIEGVISEKKTTGAMTGNFLPSKASKVIAWGVEGEGTFKHLRIYTEGGGTVSVTNLVGTAHFDSKKPTFKKSTKAGASFDKFFLSNTRKANGFLPSNQALAISQLMGKTIKGKIVVGKVLPYVVDDKNEPVYFSDETLAGDALISKDFYELELIP